MVLCCGLSLSPDSQVRNRQNMKCVVCPMRSQTREESKTKKFIKSAIWRIAALSYSLEFAKFQSEWSFNWNLNHRMCSSFIKDWGLQHSIDPAKLTNLITECRSAQHNRHQTLRLRFCEGVFPGRLRVLLRFFPFFPISLRLRICADLVLHAGIEPLQPM